jgi:hypothetical protein
MAFALDHFDPSFRTPSEVLAELDIPVLAAVPLKLDSSHKNGNGNGNGNGRVKGDPNGNRASRGESAADQRLPYQKQAEL